MPDRVGRTQEEVRRHNLGAVLEYLHRNGEASRAELTARLGLNRSTIGGLVADLSARGWVEEADPPVRRTSGRPSPLVRPRPSQVVALALELEVDMVGISLVGIGGAVLAHHREPYPDCTRDPRYVVEYAAALAGPALRSMCPTAYLAGVGVAVAGVVRRQDGLVHLAPNLGWRDVPLGRLVAQALDLDVVVRVGNDANLGALAEHTRGAGRDVDDLVYVSSEVGVGVGVLAGAHPMTGADGYFGEFGHLPLFPRGRRCRCGARGCWETEVGTHSLLRRAGRAPEEGYDAVLAVLAAAAAGDRRAGAAVGYVADRLAVGLAAIVNALNPRLIVLGGFFAELWPLAAERVERKLVRHALPTAAGSVQVVPGRLGADAMLLGAAETVLAAMVRDPTAVPATTQEREVG